MQFKVPQNIDLEDKIVGPMTLVQFLYVLSGGLIDYMLFQSLYPISVWLFAILAVPIALIALALAFVKIQDQPLPYFIKAGFGFLGRPRQRLWRRMAEPETVLTQPPPKAEQIVLPKRHIGKSELEQLAHALDTQPLGTDEAKNFGKISVAFEKMLGQKNQQGGKSGSVGQAKNTG